MFVACFSCGSSQSMPNKIRNSPDPKIVVLYKMEMLDMKLLKVLKTKTLAYIIERRQFVVLVIYKYKKVGRVRAD